MKRKKNNRSGSIRRKENFRKNTKQEDDTEEIVKNTNVIVIKKWGMSKSLREFGRDIFRVFAPYSVILYPSKIKIEDICKNIKTLNYQYCTILYMKLQKLMYRIVNCDTKLSVVFYVKSYTNASCLNKHPAQINNYNNLKPLLILKNFNCPNVSKEMSNYLMIVQNMLQSIFPKLDLNRDSLQCDKRIVLFYFNPEDQTIYFRHYIKMYKKRIHIHNEVSKEENSIFSKCSKASIVNDVTDIMNNNNNNNIRSTFNTEKKNKSIMKNFIEIGPRISLNLYRIIDQSNVVCSLRY